MNDAMQWLQQKLQQMSLAQMPGQAEFLQETWTSPDAFVRKMQAHVSPEDFLAVLALVEQSLGGPGHGVQKTLSTDGAQGHLFHLGDLVIDGNLGVFATVVVTGNLTVTGCVHDSYPEGSILVGRDLRARALFSEGEVNVGGQLVCRDMAYIHHNGALVRAQVLQAPLIVEAGPRVGAPMVSPHVFAHDDYDGGFGKGANARLKRILRPCLFGGPACEPGHLNEKKLLACLKAGDRIFRGG